MKRFGLILTIAAMVLGMASCDNSDDYTIFIGTWGVEHIDYYNIDYYGNVIENTVHSYDLTPGDQIDGIDLVFKADRSGKMIDRSRDTLFSKWDSNLEAYLDTLICPDTVIVTTFTYSYHKDDGILYMNMEVLHPFTYQMQIPSISNERFTYINEYDDDYVEKATLVRISNDTRSNPSRRGLKPSRPRYKGSLLSDY